MPHLSRNPRRRSLATTVPLGAAAALLTLCVFAPVAARSAGVVFADGFEDGTTNKWNPPSDRKACSVVPVSVDNVPPHSGGYMAECNWNGTLAWNDPAAFSMLWLKSWPYNSEFLVRIWVRMASDVDHVNGSKILRLFPNDGQHDQIYMQAYMGNTPQYLFHDWLLNDVWQPSFWGDKTSIGDGAWHKLEIYVKQNDPGQSNGIVRDWKDGKLQQEITDVVTIAPGDRWGGLSVMSNWSNFPHDANNHVEWDDVEIYSDAGTGATGLMSDATITSTTAKPTVTSAAPSPPRSVVVK